MHVFSHVPLRKIIYLFMFFICMHQYVTIHSKKQKSEVLFKKKICLDAQVTGQGRIAKLV